MADSKELKLHEDESMETEIRKSAIVELKAHDIYLEEKYRETIRVLKVLSINDFYWLDGRFFRLEKDAEEIKDTYLKTSETRRKLLEMYEEENRDYLKEKDYEKLYTCQLGIYDMGNQRYLDLLGEIKSKYSEIQVRLENVTATLARSMEFITDRMKKRKEIYANIRENEIELTEFLEKAKKMKATTVIEVIPIVDSPEKSVKDVKVSFIPEVKGSDAVARGSKIASSELEKAVKQSIALEDEERELAKEIEQRMSKLDEVANKRKKQSMACEDCLKECDELDYCVHSKKKPFPTMDIQDASPSRSKSPITIKQK